jgi:hypothetical protein
LDHLYFPEAGDDYLRRRIALLSNCNLLDHISKVDSTLSTRLREHENVFDLIYGDDVTNAPPEGLLDFLGVSQVNSDTNIFEWTARTNFMPLISGGQKPVFGDKQLAYDALGSTNFDPRAEVYLPLEAKPLIMATNLTTVKISQVQFAAQQITAQVQADAPALVVIAQNFYHPWHAYVDGARVTLWHANYAFQALETPAGTHELKLIYEDEMFRWGSVLSGISLCACAVGWLVLGRKTERKA